ncbi:DegT/DnrJ/EryC1/StrS family aminotransferase [Pontibacter sp. JH31]|uniref:DegT/DnrJ/EryC1/StrS family aminotransferase n=1 Tax=Pontibacter aquaedesilientis TaxID=2766980 RepID=A0ABR7XI17_9BACT|nr:DegT/DnrJ/EryC1/StrS family aminotransferase [Pontibacter aquaedesilientis]MBD1397942.1 DegT/DnrJ/EryC1/StrS family aminotransferase [Pontibacter aquaedesilientis]
MNYRPGRIFMSAPHLGGHEKNYVQKALDDNWVSTSGPNLPGLEHDICQHTNARHAVVLNTGTAALHLALRLLDIKPGDEVLCPTFAPVASVNPILYLGAIPVFVESEANTWNMCPETLEQAIKARLETGHKPACIVVVHLYGMPARLNELLQVAEQYGILVVEDAAEALGSRYGGHQVGTFGKMGTFSFGGNKIITTSGGGALITEDAALAERALYLSTEAQYPTLYDAHEQISYNYRLSNISAGIGRGQIEVLEKRIKERREVYNFYKDHLSDTGLQFIPEPKNCFSNRWLTTVLLDPEQSKSPKEIIAALEEHNIEAGPLWKPLHLQPLFQNSPYYGDGLSKGLVERGLCLPSGSSLTEEELRKVVQVLRNALT